MQGTDDLFVAVDAAYSHGAPIPELWAKKAAEMGYAKGMTIYGIGLGNRGRHTEAEIWLKRAIAEGDAFGALALGTMYMDLHRFEEAESLFRVARSRGRVEADDALLELQKMRARTTRLRVERPESDVIQPQSLPTPPSRALPVGELPDPKLMLDPNFLCHIGVALREEGYLQAAEQFYERAIELGSIDALNNLGNLYVDRKQYAEAERKYRKAANAGHAEAMTSLGALHHMRKEFDLAEDCFRSAAEGGSQKGMLNLATMLRRRGLFAEAEQWDRASLKAAAPAAVTPSARPRCSACNSLNDLDATFCVRCGEKLNTNASSDAGPTEDDVALFMDWLKRTKT